MPRPVTKEQIEFNQTILALVEERPYTTGELVAILGTHNGRVSMVCKSMARKGEIVRLADQRWADPSQRHEVLAPDAIPARSTAAPLRHHVSVQSTIRRDVEPSWWVGVDRLTLHQRSAERQAVMGKSKEAGIVNGMAMGWKDGL